MVFIGHSRILPLIFKKFGNLFLFSNYIGHTPVSILDYLKIEFQLNTRFVENRVIPDQT